MLFIPSNESVFYRPLFVCVDEKNMINVTYRSTFKIILIAFGQNDTTFKIHDHSFQFYIRTFESAILVEMNDAIKSDASKLLYLHKDGVRKEEQRVGLGQLLQTAENHSRLRFDAVYVIVRHCNHHFLMNIVILKICALYG